MDPRTTRAHQAAGLPRAVHAWPVGKPTYPRCRAARSDRSMPALRERHGSPT